MTHRGDPIPVELVDTVIRYDVTPFVGRRAMTAHPLRAYRIMDAGDQRIALTCARCGDVAILKTEPRATPDFSRELLIVILEHVTIRWRAADHEAH